MSRPEPSKVPQPKRTQPSDTPKPEITSPSETPITNPTSKPGIDRANNSPEYDTTDMPEERPISTVSPEFDPDSLPQTSIDSAPTNKGGIKYY